MLGNNYLFGASVTEPFVPNRLRGHDSTRITWLARLWAMGSLGFRNGDPNSIMKSNRFSRHLQIVSTVLLCVIGSAAACAGDDNKTESREGTSEEAPETSQERAHRLEGQIEELSLEWRSATDKTAKGKIRSSLEAKVGEFVDHELKISQLALKEVRGDIDGDAIEAEIASLTTKRKTHIARILETVLEQASEAADRADRPSIGVGNFILFKHGEVERRYVIHLPKGLADDAPLVFFLHGYRGDARDYMELGMNRVANSKGFAVCYPQGEKDREGMPHWNARFTISNVDDVGFLSALAAHLQDKHSLAPDKTFACGISNGGFMSYTLAAEKPQVFQAAASVIGTMSGYTWEHRDKIKPVSILQITGLNDEIVPYDGSMSPAGGWGGAPHQDVIINFWTKLNKTKTEEVVEISDTTTAHYYKDGVSGNQVWHYKIKRFGHRVPSKRNGAGVNAVDEIWKFFQEVNRADESGKKPKP